MTARGFCSRRGLLSVLAFLLVLILLLDVSEDVIEYEITIGLFCKYEGLSEFALRLGLVRDLANDLDDNVAPRTLRVDVGDTNFAILDVEVLDLLADGLR